MRKLLGAAVLLFAVHAAVAAGRNVLGTADAGVGPVGGAPGSMTSAVGGPITDLAIQFHRPGPAPVARVLRDLMAAVDPATTTVHVVVSDAEDERTLARLAPAVGHGPRVRAVRANRTITSWIHDRLLVLDPPTGGGPPTLVAPPAAHQGSAARVGDWRVPWDLRAAALPVPPRVVTARFQFDGGDLIADGQRVYVTPRLLARNADASRSREALLAEIARTVGRRVTVVGDDAHPVPDHHVGMFVTPLGEGRVLVADPDLALSVLRRAGASRDLTVGGAPLPLDLSEARLETFRNLARSLRAQGLQVIPLPALPSPDPYVLISYGNAMLEHRRDGRLHVLMPTYGVPALDAAATAIYRAAGAVVHPIAVQDVFRMGGSVGCLVAPLRRG